MLRKLALSAAVLVLALGSAEIGHRLWLAREGRTYDSAGIGAAMERFLTPHGPAVPGLGSRRTVEEAASVLMLHPYSGSEAYHDTRGVLAYFRAGVPADVVTVVVVGGSVAEEIVQTAGHELAGEIGRDPRLAGRRVRVLNYAHWGYKQPQQLARIAYLFELGYRPDVVIDVDGFNEIALARQNMELEHHPLYPSYPQWCYLVQDYGASDPEQLDLTLVLWKGRSESLALVRATLRLRLFHSSLWSSFAMNRMRATARRRGALQDELFRRATEHGAAPQSRGQVAGPPWNSDVAAGFALCATNWFESSVSLAALCRARSVRYLHVLQPTLHDPGSKPLTAKERALAPGGGAWQPSIARGYPLLREKGQGFPAAGVAFLDASGAFAEVEQDLYYDECHFVLAGTRILIASIARALLASPLEPGVGGAPAAR